MLFNFADNFATRYSLWSDEFSRGAGFSPSPSLENLLDGPLTDEQQGRLAEWVEWFHGHYSWREHYVTSSCSTIDPLDPIDDITGPVNETITFDELIQRLTQIATRDYAEWRIAASEAGADVGHVSSPEDSSEISDNIMTSLRSWIDSTGYLSLTVHQYTMLSSKMFYC